MQGAYQNAQRPLLGQPQQAQFMQGLNQNYNQAQQSTLSQLAKMGALNSDRAAQTLTGLNLGKLSQQNQYLAAAPVQNRQYADQQQNGILGLMNSLKIPYGQTTTNQQQSLTDVLNQLSSLFNNQSNQTSTGTTTQHEGGTGLFGSIFG